MNNLFEPIGAFIKALPVAAVLYWNAFIAVVPTATMLLAFAYVVLQISYLMWKWRKESKE